MLNVLFVCLMFMYVIDMHTVIAWYPFIMGLLYKKKIVMCSGILNVGKIHTNTIARTS